ncbi:Pyruvate kinase [Balamuthia mandrillaris]
MAGQAVKRSLTSSLLGGLSDERNPLAVKTQIICTIGPSTNNKSYLSRMILEGMSVARLNFSHGDYKYHESVVNNVREVVAETGKACAIMLDTKGPEIRSGKFAGETKEIMIQSGQTFTFTTDESFLGDGNQVSVTYANLPKVVSPGSQILVDDGLLSFTVMSITEDNLVVCRADNSGLLGETKGVNLPGTNVDLPAVTEKDMRDIEFGVRVGVDLIAASFIRRAEDVTAIRDLPGVREAGIRIIAKIESQQGLDNFNEILKVADGIMVARGDLGVEIPIERVATAQKMMIAKCNLVGKPVITATQMLESMINNPRPTRAEATDVANAVFDGSDCVMLSGETAKGKYPIHAVQMMSKICHRAEMDIDYRALYKRLRAPVVPPIPVPETIASSAVKTAWDINARLIICLTESGNTARLITKYRAAVPILAVTNCAITSRQLLVSRGVVPFLVDSMAGTEKLIARAIDYAKKLRLVDDGDVIVLTSGQIEEQSGSTNILRVLKVVE